jgi:hypothetical protein
MIESGVLRSHIFAVHPKTPVSVKIFKSGEYFEAKATVLYANSTLGMGLAFRDVEPDFRVVI